MKEPKEAKEKAKYWYFRKCTDRMEELATYVVETPIPERTLEIKHASYIILQ